MAERILIFRPDHIGDVLLTTPAIHALRASFPDAVITIIVGSWAAEILKGNPSVDEIIIWDLPWLQRDGEPSWKSWWKTLREIRRNYYFDQIINFRLAAKSAASFMMLPGKRKWGFDCPKCAWAHTNKVPFSQNKHMCDNYLTIVEYMGVKPVHLGLEIFFSPEEKKSVQKRFEFLSDYVVLSPGAGYSMKHWKEDRWAAIADWLQDYYHWQIVWTGGRSEESLVESIQLKMSGKSLNLTGKLTVKNLAVVMEQAVFVITVDSASMHIADAVRTPVIALFGPTNPVQWGPYPNDMPNIVISKNNEQNYVKKGLKRGKELMQRITLTDVQESVEMLVGELKLTYK